MYHITDFEAAFESDKEDDHLLEHPQQQCLPVDDYDDVAQSTLTVDGRRYLKRVRQEATKYRVIRTMNQIPQQSNSFRAESSTKQVNLSHPIWNSKALIGDTIRNFKFIRKLIKLQRKRVSEARTSFDMHFDMARAVRTRQWWLEYCFGSPRSKNENPWEDDSSFLKDSDNWQDAEDDDDEEEEDDDDDGDDDYVNENEKLDFDCDKMEIGESMLGSLHTCLSKANPSPIVNAYATGHQPQLSFLSELAQTEVIRVLRFFRIWLRRDGYRPQLGLWLYGLLSLLDPVQTGAVYHELRVLFTSCNQARMRTLIDVSTLKVERSKSTGKLMLGTCIALSSVSSITVKCVPCERVCHLRKQYSTLCLVMLVIGHFFGQRDLISALELDRVDCKQDRT